MKVAEAALQYATQELKRAENLSKRGNISRSVVDQRREAFAAAQAEIEGAKAAVQRALLDMEFTLIRAPIAGRINAKQISTGSLVSANETVLTNIASVNPIHCVFGRISVPGSPVYKGILVPDEAIASDQDRRIVYTLDEGNKVTAKVIRPGPQIDGYRVVRRGLTGEETLIVNGLMRVRPGVTVNPQVTELPLSRKRR